MRMTHTSQIQPSTSPPPPSSLAESARTGPETPLPGACTSISTCHRDRPNHRSFRRTATRRVVARVVAAAVLGVVLLGVGCADSAHASTQVLAFAATVQEVFDNIRNWLTGILAGLATVFLTVGGVMYLMANGDPGEVERAKRAFKSAGWGYGLAALAPLVVEILRRIVGA